MQKKKNPIDRGENGKTNNQTAQPLHDKLRVPTAISVEYTQP